MNLLVQRLKRYYWPNNVLGLYTLQAVLGSEPISEFVDEYTRGSGYHLGRVRHFYQLLVENQEMELDPIDIKPAGWLWLHDGHHRYAAYVLAKRLWIPAKVEGSIPKYLWDPKVKYPVAKPTNIVRFKS